VPAVDGILVRAEERGVRGRWPVVLLATGAGDEAAVVLPEHTRPFIATLATLPHEARCRLRLRVFHLLRAPAAAGDDAGPRPRRQTFKTTPASALVVEPDLLLNITDINNAEYCVRQYPLRRMTPSTPTAATLRGTLIHSAFKELLKGTGHDLRANLANALQGQLTDLALRQIAVDELAADAEPHINALSSWYTRERSSLWGDTLQVRAETFLLAPEVGLKGRLDFLLQDQRGGSLLELKTGNARADLPKREHRWQVHGYQTLLAARHPADTQRPGATLLYSATPGQAEGYGVPFALRELHRVLELRNRLALVHATGIVPPPPSPGKCAKCALRQNCLRASALLGWSRPELDEPPEPIAPQDAAWFADMYELLRLEGRANEAQAAVLWHSTAQERRDAGIALGGLAPDGEPRMTPGGAWEYRFTCDNTSELREGDEVLLSDGDPVRGAVVSGTILRLDQRCVTVWAPERVANPTLLDRYSSDIVHDRTVRNLWRWLDASPRLRALVQGTRQPSFASLPPVNDLPPQLNPEQRAAVERALAAEDFLLVQGPPGTGKTKVVAEIARRVIARGERVLVAAFTNQAVDNVLRRLVADGFEDFVRLGHELSAAPDLRAYRLAERAHRSHVAAQQVDGHPLADGTATSPADPARIRETLRTAPLVATTSATWSAERFDDVGEPLDFDLAIIDEASQLTVPALLGALRFARKFVLVGDERQLPPLVVSEEAAERGLKRSLFADLLGRWGAAASVALRSQYRMHPLICSFPSAEFYDGALVAAGDARTALLDLQVEPGDPLAPVLSPARPLVFVDVPEQIGARSGKTSQAQARVVRKLVVALLRGGIPQREIGVIAPFRAQVGAIRMRLAAAGIADVLVDTVDRFQGGERPVILFSFGGHVAETPGGRGLSFLADPHRLNVALTRAQRKLILVGNRDWLEDVPLLDRLIGQCARLYDGRGGILTARATAEEE
jgi:DNA replication ATP-dependent helicase Dna2